MTRIKPNEPCPCGSGRKFKKCCSEVGSGAGMVSYPLGVNVGGTEEMQEMINIFLERCNGEMGGEGDEGEGEDVGGDVKTYLDLHDATKFKCWDISSVLTVKNYRGFQLANFQRPHVLFAELNEKNRQVFEDRHYPEECDMVMLYHGHYRFFRRELIDGFVDDLVSVVMNN